MSAHLQGLLLGFGKGEEKFGRKIAPFITIFTYSATTPLYGLVNDLLTFKVYLWYRSCGVELM